MKLTAINPIQDAIKSFKGFKGAAYRQFPTSLCWSCQKNKERLSGKTSITQGGSIAKSLGYGAPKKFICADCLKLKEERILKKQQSK